MNRRLAVVLVLSLALPLTARADNPEFNPNAFTLHGAETLGLGGFGVEIGYGIPYVELLVTGGLFDVEGIGGFFAPALDLSVVLKSAYLLATEVGGKARLRLLKIKDEGAVHALALVGGVTYVLEESVTPKDDMGRSYREFDAAGDLVTSEVGWTGKKSLGWPFDYRETLKATMGLLYSVRAGDKTFFVGAGADYWSPSAVEITGAIVEGAPGQDPTMPGFYWDREDVWTGRLGAGMEFNLGLNLNFFLSADVMFGEDPNYGGTLEQTGSAANRDERVIASYYDPFSGNDVELKIPVVQAGGELKITGQVMAGILLFWN